MDTKDGNRCPKCGSSDVRYSHTHTTWDFIVDMLFSMDAFRCRACRARFHRADSGGPDEDELAVEAAAPRDAK